MATQTLYTFTITQVDSQALIALITASTIVTGLAYINTDGPTVSVYFKDVLSDADSATLTALMAAYVYSPPNPPTGPVNVVTQFESTTYTLKLACVEAAVGSDGTATILLKIPGTPGGTDGRYINSAEAFFDTPTAGDRVMGAWFLDHDNLLGNGVDSVIGSYTDDDAPSDNQGWYLPTQRGFVKAETIGFYGFAPSGFYLRIIGKKGGGVVTGTLYINLEWGVAGTQS